MDLSVIIPVRASAQRDVADRLRLCRFDRDLPAGIEFIVVDEGSPRQLAAQIERTCEELGLRYLHLPAQGALFSLARARNAGADVAHGRYLLLQDVDLVPPAGFYRALLQECAFQGLDQFENEFLVLPVVYLSAAETARVVERGGADGERLHDAVLTGDVGVIEDFAPVSSAVVVGRRHYAHLGGQNEAFQGWGFEDWEFAHRLIRLADRFPQPVNPDTFQGASFSRTSVFEGWRSQLRLYGDLCFRRRVFLAHAHHEVDDRYRNRDVRAGNERLFKKLTAETRKSGLTLPARPLAGAERALLIGSSPLVRNRMLWSSFNIVSAQPYHAWSPSSLRARIQVDRIDRVILDQPVSEAEWALYRQLRQDGVPILAVYRHGLSDGVILDPDGFPPDTGSLRAPLWERPLTTEEEERVLEWLSEETAPDITASAVVDLRKRLGLDFRPVLLAVFAGHPPPEADGADGLCDSGFRAQLQSLCALLEDEWLVLADDPRGRPDNYAAGNVRRVERENLDTLIALADVVVTQSEDVAVRTLLQMKPVLCSGPDTLDAPDVIERASGIDRWYEFALERRPPAHETVLRLLHHLRFVAGSTVKITADVHHRALADAVYQRDAEWAARYLELRLPGLCRRHSAERRPRMSSIVTAQLHESIVEWNVNQNIAQPKHQRDLALALLRGRPPVGGIATSGAAPAAKNAAGASTPAAKSAPAAAPVPAEPVVVAAPPAASEALATRYRADPDLRQELLSGAAPRSTISRKLSKLRRDPGRFFEDTRNPLLRSVGGVMFNNSRH